MLIPSFLPRVVGSIKEVYNFWNRKIFRIKKWLDAEVSFITWKKSNLVIKRKSRLKTRSISMLSKWNWRWNTKKKSPKPIKQKQKINVNQPENQMENFFAWSIPIASKKKTHKKTDVDYQCFRSNRKKPEAENLTKMFKITKPLKKTS